MSHDAALSGEGRSLSLPLRAIERVRTGLLDYRTIVCEETSIFYRSRTQSATKDSFEIQPGQFPQAIRTVPLNRCFWHNYIGQPINSEAHLCNTYTRSSIWYFWGARIDQFRYIKIQPKTIDLSTRLWGITTEFVGFIPQSLVLRSIV